jgi:hypothetical protein
MLFGYFILAVALLIETVGAYYSITGLAAIFSGSVVPILIMGGSLELGKVTAAVWIKNNWDRAGITYKIYLLPAVAMLMLITSMGIFGYLSKAHNDQNLVSGDVGAKLAIYDEKIKTARDNIEADRKQLQQMDAAVDQVMTRSSDEKGADKANAIRNGQKRDRVALAKDIEANQTIISRLNDEAAPIRAENRKVEAEVGPIKYIAKLIYNDNPDSNILEKAVTWVIMIIVAVFDPLALVLILAAQQSIRWAQGQDQDGPAESARLSSWFGRIRKRARFWDQNTNFDDEEVIDENKYYISDLENSEPVVDQPTYIPPEDYYRAMGLFDIVQQPVDPYINDSYTKNVTLPTVMAAIPEPELTVPAEAQLDFEEWQQETSVHKDPHPPGWMFTPTTYHPTTVKDSVVTEPEKETVESIDPLAHIVIPEIHPDDHLHRLAKNLFMSGHADKDERIFYAQYQNGEIDQLPWLTEEHIYNMPISDGEHKQMINQYVTKVPPNTTPVDNLLGPRPDNVSDRLTGEVRGFGTQFPTDVKKGDMFLRVDRLPSVLYKYNGANWIEVDKTLTDSHAYDEAYIDHLIAKIDSGEYDPELLSDAERDSIEKRLNQL